MQAEWNKWLEGMTAFKAGQGMLWIFILVLFAVLWNKGILKRSRLFLGAVLLGGLSVFPLSTVVLLKVFTPFYDWMDLQQLMPLTLLIALFGMMLMEILEERALPKKKLTGIAARSVGGICTAILLLTAVNFHGFDYRSPADEHGVPFKTAEAFDALYALIGNRQAVIVAKGEVLQYVRLYEPAWQPLYGRDLWNGKSASYINSGYDVEYMYYTLLEQAELKEQERTEFITLLSAGKVDCAVVPYYWREGYSEIPGYELLDLTDEYNVIIKKDLMAE